jgi:hypothetical protein
MQDKDPKADGQGEIVSGPEPSRLPKAADVLAAVKGLFAPRPATIGDATPERSRRKARAADPRGAAKPEAQPVGGHPAVWMAPFFLIFAALFALPHAANLLEPDAPRVWLASIVARLPDQAAPLTDILAGWLWLPWWVGAVALLLRLQAVRMTARGILDAVGWAMAALVVEGAAWLLFGRSLLAEAPEAVRDGAWRLLVAEFVFLFLTATLFGPNTYRRINWQHGGRG